MLIPLNSTMIAVALPAIALAQAGWLVTVYLITMASVQPIAGKLGDRYGRRRLILGGVAGFVVASVGCGLAPDVATLIVFRAVQAAFGAVIFPNAAALLREL